jgi:arsenate reductase
MARAQDFRRQHLDQKFALDLARGNVVGTAHFYLVNLFYRDSPRIIDRLKIDNHVKPKVLFICVHNSARSQMAEAWLNHRCGEFFEAQSAGLEPGSLNPLVIEAMGEVGIDISHKKTQAVTDVLESGKAFAYVITVCDESSAEKCPIFPGKTTRLHWGFRDPSALTGSTEEKLEQVRLIRDQIRDKIDNWCAEVCP